MTATEIQRLISSFEYKPECIETHISYVLLLDNFAYKIKKTVKLPFLDFSSLSSRKYYCEEELRLNKRLAEDMYIAVVPVKEHDRGMILEGDNGHTVDYAVKMRRLDTALEMDWLLSEKQVKKAHIDKLAQKIAAFHVKAPVIKKECSLSQFKSVFNEISEEMDFVKEHLGQAYAQIITDAIQLSDQFLEANMEFIRYRSREGLVRDVHGDLHSKNIFLYDEPVIFDCIEFNPDFRQIDLLNEIAFFCMDLEARDATHLSQHFYERYLDLMLQKGVRQAENNALFTYFKLYRANVRAKVMSISAQENMQSESFQDQIQEVSGYIKLLGQYADELKKQKQA